jgi:hypothetical protein
MQESFNGFHARPATSSVRCPRCRSRTLDLTETVECTTTWSVKNGVLDINEGFHEPGCITGVEAECVCGHHWKLRRCPTIYSCTAETEPADVKEPTR